MPPSIWKSVYLLLVVCSAAALSGCGSDNQADNLDPEAIRKLASLPGAKDSANGVLRDEIARIESERGLPQQLKQAPIATENNFAAALKSAFAELPLEDKLAKARDIFPQGEFSFHPLALEKALHFRRSLDGQVQQIRKASIRSGCNFDLDYERGCCADLAFVDRVELYVHLESFHAAEQLAQDNPNAAIVPLRAMLDVTAKLAALPHVVSRMVAVQLRKQCLLVLEAIVQHPQTKHADLILLNQMLGSQLANWPADADTWIGDRAQGLHFYEIIRAGGIFDVLTEQEYEEFSTSEELKSLSEAMLKRTDADEIYYLDAMRRVIQACDLPYYKRAKTFETIQQELHHWKNKPEYPIAAGRLLLPGIERAQQQQAEDRARVECWAVAIALAADLPKPNHLLNPATGKDYAITVEQKRVVCWTNDAIDRESVVPRIKP